MSRSERVGPRPIRPLGARGRERVRGQDVGKPGGIVSVEYGFAVSAIVGNRLHNRLGL